MNTSAAIPVAPRMFDYWKPREKMTYAEMREELAFLMTYLRTRGRLVIRPELEERCRLLKTATELAD